MSYPDADWPLRKELLLQIADLWRSAWGQIDGRTGKRWILEAVEGDSSQLLELKEELVDAKNYYLH